jgi:hypothetical protein
MKFRGNEIEGEEEYFAAVINDKSEFIVEGTEKEIVDFAKKLDGAIKWVVRINQLLEDVNNHFFIQETLGRDATLLRKIMA